MSRSNKKTPVAKDRSHQYRKFAKKEANRKVRRSNFVPNGKQYRKLFETYDIYDYRFYGGTKQQAKKDFESNKRWYRAKTMEETINKWEKWYFRK